MEGGSIALVKLVFVVLLLVLVVGVGLVASGRGTALGDVEPDRPPVGLPPGPLTPGDVQAVRFPLALRGYRMHEVDEVLDRLGQEIVARDARIAELEYARAGLSPPGPAASPFGSSGPGPAETFSPGPPTSGVPFSPPGARKTDAEAPAQGEAGEGPRG